MSELLSLYRATRVLRDAHRPKGWVDECLGRGAVIVPGERGTGIEDFKDAIEAVGDAANAVRELLDLTSRTQIRPAFLNANR